MRPAELIDVPTNAEATPATKSPRFCGGRATRTQQIQLVFKLPPKNSHPGRKFPLFDRNTILRPQVQTTGANINFDHGPKASVSRMSDGEMRDLSWVDRPGLRFIRVTPASHLKSGAAKAPATRGNIDLCRHPLSGMSRRSP